MSELQLLENPSEGICLCNDREPRRFFTLNRAALTIDNCRFSHGEKTSARRIKEYLVFPYRFREWLDDSYHKYACQVCKRIPFKVVSKKEVGRYVHA